ncbi:putative uncharacterized protein [Parachlamydia acanthamoebae UV-7]|uniref:Uncharacterized protein n=2 Tax=Parachlamydia acanthamoebae TaxID=83552 RepID=F8L0P7_PARAV|nr:hypothetical protein [Parachlamydia acanthamoebae]KIA77482.1 hypothetical protein DB43_GF00240 [Parachlamydia acanthamoebae]CCB86797.1 putative uncharacterized protein [Parachlamydia acanthamoebae UV-7]
MFRTIELNFQANFLIEFPGEIPILQEIGSKNAFQEFVIPSLNVNHEIDQFI